MSDLTHFDEKGQAHMVDVGDKPSSRRVAVAEGVIEMREETLEAVATGSASKGDVLGVARLAGIMAAKKTADLVPLCHPLALSKVVVDFSLDRDAGQVRCSATVECVGPTGVEMEALCAVQVALLTIYDMCKSMDKGMQIDAVRLRSKSGGRSGTWVRDKQGANEP